MCSGVPRALLLPGPVLYSPLTPPRVIISRVRVADVDAGGVKAADGVADEKDGVMTTL